MVSEIIKLERRYKLQLNQKKIEDSAGPIDVLKSVIIDVNSNDKVNVG